MHLIECSFHISLYNYNTNKLTDSPIRKTKKNQVGAQQVYSTRTSAVVQAHISCYASAQQLLCGWKNLRTRKQELILQTTSIASSDNFYCSFR